MNLKYPKIVIKIKNITVWSLFVQVCAGLHWKKKSNFHENIRANQRKLGKKVSEVLCRNLKHPKMLIEIKNITVWSFVVQVCAGLHWNFHVHESIKKKKWKKVKIGSKIIGGIVKS